MSAESWGADGSFRIAVKLASTAPSVIGACGASAQYFASMSEQSIPRHAAPFGKVESLHEVAQECEQQHQVAAEHSAALKVGADHAQKHYDRNQDHLRDRGQPCEKVLAELE